MQNNMEGINKQISSCAILGFVFVGVLVCASASTQSNQPDYELSCNEAIGTMQPCLVFFEGWGPDLPPPECCWAASRLIAMVTTPEARKAVCQCFKDTRPPPIVLHRVQLLRQACAHDLPIPTDPNQDCKAI